jgi:putative ABC transport system permease protein
MSRTVGADLPQNARTPFVLQGAVARAGLAVPLLIAWRNLVNDRARLIVTLIGIVFSVVLVGMQIGLLLNFISTTSMMVDRSGADILITAPGVRTFDISTPQSERRRYEALAVPGVANAEVVIIDFGQWKRTDGVRELVMVVGVAPNATMGLPWNLVGGASAQTLLAQPDGVIIDRLYAEKLGVLRQYQVNEINDIRVRVVGFTERIRTFTQSPFVFTSLENARRIMGRGDKHISYVLVRTAAGHDLEDVRRRLQERLPDTQAVAAADFARNSSHYWLFTTGAGISLIMSAVLGLSIGGVVVAQTLYASTMDRLPEYAMLRAIGGPAEYLYLIVLLQAGLAGVIGYAIGLAMTAAIVSLSSDASAAPEMPPWLAVAIGVATLADCLLAAAVSLRVVMGVDPVKAFR